MSTEQTAVPPASVRPKLLEEIAELSVLDQAAVYAVAHKVRLAIAEGNAQSEGLGLLGAALVGAELQEQAS